MLLPQYENKENYPFLVINSETLLRPCGLAQARVTVSLFVIKLDYSSINPLHAPKNP